MQSGTAGVADPAVVDENAASWTAGQLECRLARFHAWDTRSTLLLRHSNGRMQVEQRCRRRCGVLRRAWWHPETGHLLTGWSLDYKSNAAQNYLMRDEHGKSVGRIDESGMARLRLRAWSSLPVIEVEDG